MLSKVEEANQIGRRLPPDGFYNTLISEKMDVQARGALPQRVHRAFLTSHAPPPTWLHIGRAGAGTINAQVQGQ